MRLLQGREGTGHLSITDRMDVQLSVEETYAGALLEGLAVSCKSNSD